MNSEISLIAKSLSRPRHSAVVGGKSSDDLFNCTTVDNDFHVRELCDKGVNVNNLENVFG
jgi:hypothetical protein